MRSSWVFASTSYTKEKNEQLTKAKASGSSGILSFFQTVCRRMQKNMQDSHELNDIKYHNVLKFDTFDLHSQDSTNGV